MKPLRLLLPLILTGLGVFMAADSLDFTGRLDRIAPENFFFPPSGPAQRLFQGLPAKSKFLSLGILGWFDHLIRVLRTSPWTVPLSPSCSANGGNTTDTTGAMPPKY